LSPIAKLYYLIQESAMFATKPIHRIAVVGTGVIGSSWAAFYLAHGFEVVATDPAPNAEADLRRYVQSVWPILVSATKPNAQFNRMEFTRDLEHALSHADFVQENSPEIPELKIKLFKDMDELTPPDSIIASSSSGVTMSVMQSACNHPDRCVVGHPFNPPHVMPLVEVVGGRQTSAETIQRAMSFYASIGKKPIHLRKELLGHAANRLQAALYREVIYLIEQDVLSVADADAVVTMGPGLRWGVMGPNLIFHLGGGLGGIQHFMEHLAGPFSAWWNDLGHPDLTPELKQKIIDGVLQEVGKRSIDELSRERDEIILGLLDLRARAGRET
jgi:3-hydroxyacyl-CoA dehydrogenase